MVPSTQLQYSVESTGKYKSKVVRYVVFTLSKGGGDGGGGVSTRCSGAGLCGESRYRLVSGCARSCCCGCSCCSGEPALFCCCCWLEFFWGWGASGLGGCCCCCCCWQRTLVPAALCCSGLEAATWCEGPDDGRRTEWLAGWSWGQAGRETEPGETDGVLLDHAGNRLYSFFTGLEGCVQNNWKSVFFFLWKQESQTNWCF